MIADAVPFRYRARPIRIIDADTHRLIVDAGFSVRVEIDLRLAGVDAPELHTDAGEDALDFVIGLFAEHAVWDRAEAGGWPLRVETLRRASGAEVRSFARWLGHLHIVQENGQLINVATSLVEAGHAALSTR